MSCPYVAGSLNTRMLGRMATQYKESTKFREFISVFAVELELLEFTFCSMYTAFSVDDAVGDQLDVVGTAAGWPRCHCEGEQVTMFGFSNENDCCNPGNVLGWCETTWGGIECGGVDAKKEFCFDDDMYRKFIKAKLIKNTSNGNPESLMEAARILFGANATIISSDGGVIKLATGRILTALEKRIAHLYKFVLPLTRGVGFQLIEVENPFGIGTGWGGWCDGKFGRVLEAA